LAAILTAALASPAFAQSNSKEIIALPAPQLVEILKNPNAPVFDKAKACQRLAVVGDKEAIPALVALLADENLNLYARFGLEGIPDPAVDAAFRDAATKLQGRPLIGVLDSIGQRKDAKAVDLLKGFLGNADTAVVSAAAGALGRIGTVEAAAPLTEAVAKDSPVKTAIADSCLACAEGLAAVGKNAEAIALYEVVGKQDLPKYLKVAALYGQFHVKKADGLDLLLAQIRSSDEAFFNLGLLVARKIPGENATTALAGEVKALPVERQALLILALGDRKETAGVLPLLREAIQSESPVVRAAAFQVLAKIGGDSAGGVLLAASLGEGEAAVTAKNMLKTLPGKELDVAITAQFNNANAKGKAKATLCELVGARRIAAADPLVRQSMTDADEAVRIAATAALAQLIELKDLDLLTARAFGKGSEAEVQASKTSLQVAAQRMSDRDGCATKLAVLLAGATPADQTYLMELIGKVSGGKALEVIVTATKSTDPATKDTASRVLGEWVNADAAPALLEILKNDKDEKFQTRALRGYIRAARQFQLPADAKLAMFNTAMEVSKRDEERKLALEILSRIPSAQTLQIAVSYLDKPVLKDAAGDAAVKISVKIVGSEAKAVAEAMQKVVDAGVGGKPGEKAKQLLDQAKAAIK
jgi:HEAT repeat protein